MSFTYQRRYSGPVRLVVLDLAGTVVDYGSCAPAGAFVELFARHGVEATTDEAREPMGMHKRDHIRAMSKMPSIAAGWERAKGKPATEEDVESLFQEFIPLQLSCLTDYRELIPGAAETVRQLQSRGVKVATTTGYNEEMLEIVLSGAAEQGLRPDAAGSAAQVAAGRPAPWLIYRCMEELGVFPPEAVVKIGDTIADVEAGLNAGVWSVGVVETGNMVGLPRSELEALPDTERTERYERGAARLRVAGAHMVVPGIADCLAVIEEIEERLEYGDKP